MTHKIIERFIRRKIIEYLRVQKFKSIYIYKCIYKVYIYEKSKVSTFCS